MQKLKTVLALGAGVLAALIGVGCTTGAASGDNGRAANAAGNPRPEHVQVQIRRMADGVPHIEAADWTSLGYGVGFAQASDNLCTMADAFVTYRGERSRYFGADAHLPLHSTYGQPKNIDADFFFRLIDTNEIVETYRQAQPPQIRQLVHGFAAGYNRVVQSVRDGSAPARQYQACRGQAWLSDITEADIYRRLYAANLAGGYAQFVTAIATATPPSGNAQTSSSEQRNSAEAGIQTASLDSAAQALSQQYFQAGGHVGLGSNGIAFGGDATPDGQPLLFGNPHWFWRGPDRFYQQQLTIPGQLNVSGAGFLGVPLVMIGFNDSVAWTHTVSSARRFGVFQLSLQQGKPTTYLFDGKPEPMTAVPLTIDVLDGNGQLIKRTRTLYRTRFGPLVNLGAMSPAFAWNGQQAFAIRDINADNFRVFRNFLAWDQARSLDDFIAIQRRLAAVPWVNTLAIGRGDRRAWYADIGAVPNVPDELAAQCATKLAPAFAKGAPGVPLLDGSRSSCNWRTDAGSPQPGAFAASSMPSLLRTDYVANMNNSYWLTNPAQPLTGYPRIFGGAPEAPGLRARLGHLMIAQRMAGSDGLPGRGATNATVRDLSLNSRVLSAELFKAALLAQVCVADSANRIEVSVPNDPAAAASAANAANAANAASAPGAPASRKVDITAACRVLRGWDNTGATQSRGAPLWGAFWSRAEKIGDAKLYATQFDPADPLNTPRGLQTDPARLGAALGAAVLDLQKYGVAIDATTGELLSVTENGRRIPLYGGCSETGYFTAACVFGASRAKPAVDAADLAGNSYMQTVGFAQPGAEGGPVAYTMMADAQSDDPGSPYFSAGTLRYASKDWLRMPFATGIASDAPRGANRNDTNDTIRLDATIDGTAVTGARQ